MDPSGLGEILSVFVYGTLKKNQLRGRVWPRSPEHIQLGLLQAELYDLGPYPAIIPGNDWVLGEIWQFSSTDIEPTLKVLDQIEGYQPGNANNEYNRQTARVFITGEPEALNFVECWAYFCANEHRLVGKRKIEPFLDISRRRVAQWPDSLSHVPKSFAEEINESN